MFNEWLVAVTANYTATLLAGITLGAISGFLISIFRWRVREHSEQTSVWLDAINARTYKQMRVTLSVCAVTLPLLLILGSQAHRALEADAPPWTWGVFAILLVLVGASLLLLARMLWLSLLMTVGNSGYFIAMVQEGRRFDDPPEPSTEVTPATVDEAPAALSWAIRAAAVLGVGFALGVAQARRSRR